MIIRAALFVFALSASLASFASFTLSAAGCATECWKCESDADCRGLKTARDDELVEYCLFGQCQECAADAHCESGRCDRGRCDVVDGGTTIGSQDAGP